MSIIDLKCRESLTFVDGAKCPTCKNDKLQLGYNYKSCLFFELPPSVFFSNILKANLVLFKIPIQVTKYAPATLNSWYHIAPLLNYFSIYTNCYAPPSVDNSLCLNYMDEICLAYTEIDITPIAAAWSSQRLENKGLLLTGTEYSQYLVYASQRYDMVGMRPMLRLTYENISQPLHTAQCTVEAIRHGATDTKTED